MNFADFVILGIILIALIISLCYIRKKKKSGSCCSCSGNCSACKGCNFQNKDGQ